LAAEPRSAGGTDRSVALGYDGYVAGVNVTAIRAGLELRSDHYALGVAFRTVGVVGLLLHGDMHSLADGAWRNGRALPSRYASAGIWRGSRRQIEIDYPDGQPHIAMLEPSVESERDPVPDVLRRDTMDTLSAIAFLLETVAATGRCDGAVATYDGRRVSQVSVHTIGSEILPPDSRSSFSGPALRCDLDGQQIAGFPKDAGPDDMLRQPQHSSVWLAAMQPGMPAVPVLMSVPVRLLGHMTLYVTRSQPGAQLAEFSPRMP
jgi:hypothetical protein